ncbi:MAG: helicase-related protein [Thermodesulfovibrionales bacterium]
MHDDLTFFTNESGATILDRFRKTLKDVQFFDILVGYFRTSGFFRLYKSFETIDKIRVLVGINVDKTAFEIIESSKSREKLDFESHKRTKEVFSEDLTSEMEHSEDTYDTEIGVRKFIEFLQSRKLEIKAYPSSKIHAKVYISRFSEDDRDYGRVITGSSNFSESGLVENLEFNVELKNSADVKYALDKFETLWKDAVDISREYVETINARTWLNDSITPYELYLKFLYEYLKEDINIDEDFESYLPEGFLDMKYQKQAVVSAKKILEAYNGVFLSDVVGLGKTYISALLAQQLPGKILVICPPVLQDYWHDTFFEFGIRGYKVESLGKLDQIIKSGAERFDYIFIDEAHRFRNEVTLGYEKLHEICFGKKVILVSATPLNNTIDDIYSQLKLFQVPKKSTIPGVQNLEKFFSSLKKRIKKYQKSDPEYIDTIKLVSKEVRDKILKFVMVRRTRTEVMKYFSEDMEKQGVSFPELDDPKRIIYTFDEKTGNVFNRTIALLKDFSYSRYTPLLYLKTPVSEFELQSQRNIGGFMKGILVKRLESSFHAFKKTLVRFVDSYRKFIDMYQQGTVYISKKVNVYDFLDSDNEEELLKLVDLDRVQKYESPEFTVEFLRNLQKDLTLLENIQKLWSDIDSDPKLEKFINELKENLILKENKVVVFTESKETGEYLFNKLNKHLPLRVLFYSSVGGLYGDEGKSIPIARDLIKENFDPKSKPQKDDISILITTDILAEGINLHRSNTVINYDLPWNPTRVLQRVGRVNRVGTKHKVINIFNFFPTAQSDMHLGLEANIKAKIQAFHDTLGEDSKYLTEEEEISTHELFGDIIYKRLSDKKTFQGEDEEGRSELEYLHLLRTIRDKNTSLFEKIKRLPKKARTCREIERTKEDNLVTFFRKGKLKKFFLADSSASKEITFFEAADLFKCDPVTPKSAIPKTFYALLDLNKSAFDQATSEETIEKGHLSGSSNESYIIKRLKAREMKDFQGFTEEDEDFLKSVFKAFENGVIPKNTSKRLKNELGKENSPLKVLAILRKNLPPSILSVSPTTQQIGHDRREVILSEYLKTAGS